ncbi:acyltransferase [Mucilaginibacter myungsuensis]|uniref:acyltransferase n=1 Tax=Mucilaginibacter myungsuensis TaxID=649104 RepID=UPI001D16770E|nr:acyltransferase [Mucilaginibacter myungsuensis]MDN3598536.1 acyltransferase [Mucilaginibacter myungsuensis]
MAINTPTRNYGMDLLRVLACYMVIQVHAGEFYYIHKDGDVLHTADASIVGWYNSLFRICVPLFVAMTGFFMFPVGDSAKFFKKRLGRVLVPFVLWCSIYAAGHYVRENATIEETLINLTHIPINYGSEVGHLWYVYMLIGLYLFAPIISPWVQTATRKGMEFYLVIWAVACSLPYIHLLFPAVWGEVWWNRTPLLYYFSGLLGYVILAAYIKRFHMPARKWNYYLGAALIIVGYLITALTFQWRLPISEKV